MSQVMLTTLDNPYNPFTHWDEWYAWDIAHGYKTCQYLARIAKTSDILSDEENDEIVDQAIDEIVRFNINGMYTKAYDPKEKQSNEA